MNIGQLLNQPSGQADRSRQLRAYRGGYDPWSVQMSSCFWMSWAHPQEKIMKESWNASKLWPFSMRIYGPHMSTLFLGRSEPSQAPNCFLVSGGTGCWMIQGGASPRTRAVSAWPSMTDPSKNSSMTFPSAAGRQPIGWPPLKMMGDYYGPKKLKLMIIIYYYDYYDYHGP